MSSDEQLANEPMLDLPIIDDTGAKDHEWYGWQHHCGAHWLMAAIRYEKIAALVCETHEDFLVLHEDRSVTAVSVKHRETGSRKWTPKDLCKSGGVKHLFKLWVRAAERPGCCVMTSGQLSPGDDGAEAFARACASKSPDRIARWASELAPDLDGDASVVGRFLPRLRINYGLPERRFVVSVNVRQYMQPLLRELGIAADRDELAYQRLVRLVHERSGDQAADGMTQLAILSDPSCDWESELISARLAQRVIRRQDALAEVLEVASAAGPLLRAAEDAPPPTRMVSKLEGGALGTTTVGSAKELRAAWYSVESRMRGVPVLQEEIEDLRMRVREVAGSAEDHAAAQGRPYGRSMLDELRTNLTVGRLSRSYSFPLDDLLLRGLAFQLTDECKVWWSPREDVDAP